jgi:hypothetical protein
MCKKNQAIDSFKTRNTFNYLRKASEILFDEAKSSSEASAYKYMMSMITSAFFLEAYLNYLGQKNIAQNNWKKWERKSSREKLKDLAAKINYEIDFSKKPFQTFQEIFNFRNLIVHAKPQFYSISKKLEEEQTTIEPILESEWQSDNLNLNWKRLINRDQAEIFLGDAIQIVKILHTKADLPSTELSTLEYSETRGY